MTEYIDWSARECDSSCVFQLVQRSIEMSQSAQMAVNNVAEAQLTFESIETMINEITEITENTEEQVIDLRIDIHQLSEDITHLMGTINNSMDHSTPIIDDNLIELITVTLIAFTICITVCLFIICYSKYMEVKKERRRIIATSN